MGVHEGRTAAGVGAVGPPSPFRLGSPRILPISVQARSSLLNRTHCLPATGARGVSLFPGYGCQYGTATAEPEDQIRRTSTASFSPSDSSSRAPCFPSACRFAIFAGSKREKSAMCTIGDC